MPASNTADQRFGIGHVLFIDIVGYSELLINQQSELLRVLNDVVRAGEQFQSAEAEGKLVRLPTGDGMALVFRNSPEEPARCAVEISRRLQSHPELRVRMGIHSGPVNEVADVNERANIAGAGINIAERVMSCGDAGHILLSKHVAEDLEHSSEWRGALHDIGECEVKHGQRIAIVNLHTDEFGNSELPQTCKTAQQRESVTFASQRARRRSLALMASIALVGVGAAITAALIFLPHASARKIDKSIAVLPFENLSDEKENAYFADGIQDDILTNLSKIGDLKVISRTSVMGFRGKAPNVRDIGRALGVATILEGSVRRAGNRVRVNVQLIDTNTDQHIWANDYDRDLTDVFAIQTDLAQSIANELQAKLSPTEKERMTRKPTGNNEAYLAFVRAHDLWTKSAEDISAQKEAEQLYQRAIDLDPNFALAHARYSQLESWIFHSWDRTPERGEKARRLAERALQLQPDLPEAHLARGFSYYYGDNNYAAALREFETAHVGLPNESEVYLDIGAIQRRQGKWTDSNTNLEKAVELNPNDWWPLQNLAFNYGMLRKWDSANKTVDRGLQVNPRGLSLWDMKAKLAVAEKGDLTVGERCFEHSKSIPMSAQEKAALAGSRVDFLLLQHNYQQLLTEADAWPDEMFAAVPGSLALKYFAIGVAHKLLGNNAKAQTALLRARDILEGELKRQPEEPKLRSSLAKILALVGEKERALAEAQRAADLRPESKDAFDGPEMTESMAEVYTLVGDQDRAIDLLEGLLNRPSPVNVPTLKLNPVWDPLRGNPRFQALIDKYGAKA